jgi:predicted RNase H-like HicB family nuclease
MQFTAVLTQAEEGGFIALNPETGTTTQGETINEALSNLQEATALYLEEFPVVVSDHLWR